MVMKTRKNARMSTETLTMGAVLTALVVVLQGVAPLIAKIPGLPFEFTLVLIPIVIGAAKCGPYMGGWLGLVFGMLVLFIPSEFTVFFLSTNAFGTIFTVLAKGFLCGLASGFVYRLLEKKSKTIAVYVAAAVCPMVNTGVFFLGCLLFFMDTVAGLATAYGLGDNVALYMFSVLAGVNFIVEFITNVLLSRIIIRVLGMKKESKLPLPEVDSEAQPEVESSEDGQN